MNPERFGLFGHKTTRATTSATWPQGLLVLETIAQSSPRTKILTPHLAEPTLELDTMRLFDAVGVSLPDPNHAYDPLAA